MHRPLARLSRLPSPRPVFSAQAWERTIRSGLSRCRRSSRSRKYQIGSQQGGLFGGRLFFVMLWLFRCSIAGILSRLGRDTMLHHRPSALLLVAVLCLPLSHAAGQLQTGNIHVCVTFPDDRSPTLQLKVALLGSGNKVAETYTNDHGQAQFVNVGIGNYLVSVSGQGIQTTVSEMFEVDARRGTQSIFVRVRPAEENGGSNVAKGGGAT